MGAVEVGVSEVDAGVGHGHYYALTRVAPVPSFRSAMNLARPDRRGIVPRGRFKRDCAIGLRGAFGVDYRDDPGNTGNLEQKAGVQPKGPVVDATARTAGAHQYLTSLSRRLLLEGAVPVLPHVEVVERARDHRHTHLLLPQGDPIQQSLVHPGDSSEFAWSTRFRSRLW